MFSLPSSRKTRGVGGKLEVLIFIVESDIMKTLETTVSWVDFQGYPVKVGGDITAQERGRRLRQIQYGEVVGDISELIFRDSHCFKTGELHNDFEYWRYITQSSPLPQQTDRYPWLDKR